MSVEKDSHNWHGARYHGRHGERRLCAYQMAGCFLCRVNFWGHEAKVQANETETEWRRRQLLQPTTMTASTSAHTVHQSTQAVSHDCKLPVPDICKKMMYNGSLNQTSHTEILKIQDGRPRYLHNCLTNF